MGRSPQALLLLSALLGCASSSARWPVRDAPVLREDGYDHAYLLARRQQGTCQPANSAFCCAHVDNAVEQAFSRGALQEAAEQLDLYAMSCRRPSDVHLARFRERRAPDLTDPLPHPRVSLAYDVRVLPGDRIYWAGAFIDGRQLVTDEVTPGSHHLEVEVHVLPLKGVGANQLYRLRKRLDVEVPAARPVDFVVMLRRTLDADPDRAFAILVTGSSRGEESPGQPAGSQRIQNAAMLESGSIHPPTELYDERGWQVLAKICVDGAGHITGVQPLVRMHPRDAGALIDWIIRLPHRPAVIDDKPAPFCYPLRFEVRSS
jgi:hypothetical protein